MAVGQVDEKLPVYVEVKHVLAAEDKQVEVVLFRWWRTLKMKFPLGQSALRITEGETC